MRIRTLGLKARDHDVELARLTVLSAPNGTGKSTLADAIRFCALGYVPALGKRPADSAALMRNGRMEVEITSGGSGRTIRRWLEQSGTGCKRGAEASWLKKAGQDEHAQAILELFGAEEQDVAECLDIRQLLAATPAQRAQRIETLLSAGRKAPAALAQDAARLTVQRLVDLPDERMPAKWTEAWPLVAEPHKAVLQEQQGMIVAKLEGGGIPGALTWANDSKNAAARDLAGKSKAKAEIEARVAQLPPAAAGEMERLEAERSRLEREIGAARERQAEARRKTEAFDQAQAELAGRKAQFGRAASEVERIKKLLPDPAGARAELEDVKKKLDTLAPPAPPAESTGAAAIRNEIAKLEHALSELFDPEIPDASEAQEEYERLSRALGEAKKSPWYEVARVACDVEEAAGKSKKLKECAHRLQALAKKHGPQEEAEAVAVKLDRAEKAFERAHAEAEQARESAGRVKEERARLVNRRADLARKLMTVNVDSTRAGAETRAAFDRARNELIIRRCELEERLDALHDAEEALVHAQAALDHAARRASELGPAEASAVEETAGLQKALADVRAQIGTLQGAAATRAELTRIVAEIGRLEAAREVFAAVEWGLQRLREREITEAQGPLMETMARFLSAAGRSESPFFRASRASTEIGWRTQAGTEVSIAALSGGEFCLFAAALTASVIILRQASLRFLLVEAGEADRENLHALLRGIEAIANQLTCAIVSTQQEVEAEGWSVITLSKVAAEVAA